MSTIHSVQADRSASASADSTRRTALVVGWLFIITFVTSIAAKFGFYPPIFDGDYVTGPGQDTRVLWGALSELLLIIANIGSAVALFSLLRRYHENLALAFVTARLMESAFIAVGILGVVTLVTYRQDHIGSTDAAVSLVGEALTSLQEWTFLLGPGFVVGVGNGLILGYLMYTSRLVPRALALLGLVGGPLICLSGAAVVLGVIDGGSVWQGIATVPEFFWELGFGVYLIVKGFLPSTPGTSPAATR
jgi:succinate dehydrogenase hydrophobic anchor subunit